MLRGGFGALLIVMGILYFTGAGNWLWSRVQELDSACYTGLMRVSPSIASPVCGAIEKGITAADGFFASTGDSLKRFEERVSNSLGFTELNDSVSGMVTRIGALASSNETLRAMMQQGPGSLRLATGQSLQQAIDSFTIGQSYLNYSGGESQALEWFRHGAAQPGGYGVMSQLALGNIYMGGTNASVTQNPQLAKAYLEQAKQSISALSRNPSPGAQQVLQTLPASPQTVQAQIDQAIRQLGTP